jgi:hypothetical protein
VDYRKLNDVTKMDCYKKRETSRNTFQAQPSEEKNGDIPLGYSGRTALRREKCYSKPETIYKR